MSYFATFTQNEITGYIQNRAPAMQAINVTPSDVTIYDPPFRGFKPGTTGNIAVLTYQDWINGLTAATIIPCVGGIDNPLFVAKIFSTGTTAMNIVGYLN